ncbi:MAG: radical SAM family heme chaperone HemW [Aristaeellaceae bacterium]
MMELYVHLPFCKCKCRYCDFASYAGQEAVMPAYVDALLKEAAHHAVQDTRLSAQALGVETAFLGGGTPSLLPAELLARLLAGLQQQFTFVPDAEFTSEANPGTLTAEWLHTAVIYGINRLSLGMQAYQPSLLRMLGRIHDFAQVEASVRMAREAGIRNLNLDLMFGLPGQTSAMWRETLEAALSLSPQHLSCYGLIPEDGTPLKADLDAGRLTLPDEETERQMYDDTLTLLHVHGFEQYEISNFALPGYACRHNLGYWQQVPYLGLGASAASCMDACDGNAYVRASNPSGLQDYLCMVRDEHWQARMLEPITPTEAIFETMMLGLRTTLGVSEEAFLHRHGRSMDAVYGVQLRSLEAQGLIERTDGYCRLTRRGMDVQNYVLVTFMDD